MYALLYKGKWTNTIIDLEYMHKEKGIRKSKNKIFDIGNAVHKL